MLLELVDRVTARLRNGNRLGRTVTLRFRFDDFARDTRSHTLTEPTDSTTLVLDTAHDLLSARRDEMRSRGLTLLGLTVANLSAADIVQQALVFERRSAPELDAALDGVRDRFGTAAIGRTTLAARADDPTFVSQGVTGGVLRVAHRRPSGRR